MKREILSLEDNIEKQFNIVSIKERFQNIISIRCLFILDDNSYLYQVFNNCREEWYIITDDKFMKLDIKKFVTNDMTREIIFSVGEDDFFTIVMYYRMDEQGFDNIYIELQRYGEKYFSQKDHYLYNMFFDILEMNKN